MGRYRRSPRGEHFAQVPVEVLESEAYQAIPDYAVRVLLGLASEYRGGNNSDLSLPAARARRLGITSAWKVTAGLQTLSEVGLALVCRQGKYRHGRGIAALYALTWRRIDVNEKAYPPIRVQQPAPNTWAQWKRPADWSQRLRETRRRAKGSKRIWRDVDAYDQSSREDDLGT
jgi:hypothetical protein